MNDIIPSHNQIKNILMKHDKKLLEIHKKGIVTCKIKQKIIQFNDFKLKNEIDYYKYLINKTKTSDKKKYYLIKLIILKMLFNPKYKQSNVYIILIIINKFKIINHQNYNIRNITNIINFLCCNKDIYDVINFAYSTEELLSIN
jgi:hypothetical protein